MSASTEGLIPDRSQQLLASVWQRSLPLIRQRLARLDAAAQHSDLGLLSADSRKEASEIAHKLAGSLGMFGYARGTEIARELEVLLEEDGPVSVGRFESLLGQLGRALPI